MKPAEKIPSIVLVHGAWHGAWCWNQTQFDLALLGRSSIALDWANHGLQALFPKAQTARPFDPVAMATQASPAIGVSLVEAATELADRIAALSHAAGGPVAVVAHSLGGVLANAAAELAAQYISSLIYVCAIAPVRGATASDYRTARENEGSRTSDLQTGHPPEIGAARIDAADPLAFQRLKETFFDDIDENLARAAVHFMTPDVPLRLLRDPVATGDNFGAIPRAYVVCTRDNAFREAAQYLCIGEMDRAYPGRRTAVDSLPSSHSPFLSCPADLARLIDYYSRDAFRTG
ncbi:Esterase EstC [Novosphingobium resinovorum]|uniref:Esterase EstC n=1 Tax=Novosphingobium resinovorum TaxID=158500 RepID=A0A031K3Z7_9SPHN|nr:MULTISPECIES: alpha/beta fold hydrolase [Novosphingobium]EZP83965.1 Esterase EstC [Novosphingobium resinovorum]